MWSVLALLWLLFLVQALFPPTSHASYSALGAAFWAVIQLALLMAAVVTWRRRRAEVTSRRDRQPPSP